MSSVVTHPDSSNQHRDLLDPTHSSTPNHLLESTHPSDPSSTSSDSKRNPAAPPLSSISSVHPDLEASHHPSSPSSSSSSPSQSGSRLDETDLRGSSLDIGGYLNDLPSLTPSKLASRSVSDSESDSIPDRFTDDDDVDEHDEDSDDHEQPSDPTDPTSHSSSDLPPPPHGSQPHHHHRTPASQNSISTYGGSHISLSEPGPIRSSKIGRKRSLSALVALRYRGGKVDSEIGDEERGLLALDLDTYINSGDPELPETRALPPSALFPTLSAAILTPPGTAPIESGLKTKATAATMSKDSKLKTARFDPVISSLDADPGDDDRTIDLVGLGSNVRLLSPTPRSEWPLGGGTGPGKTSRGFIPGHPYLQLHSPTRSTSAPHTTTSTSSSEDS